MKKDTLLTFIKRYNLGNLIPKAKWRYSVNDKLLHTRAVADNRSFIVDVIMHNFQDFGPDDLVLCFGDTEKVKGMLSPFGDDISMAVNKNGDRVLGITISDPDCESYCTCADPASIDPVCKTLQDIPEYNVIIPLSEEFLSKFLKAQTALKEVGAFSVAMNKRGVFEVVIGYTTSNSNRIRITPVTDPEKNKMDGVLTFVTKNIIEVFKANSDIPNGTLSIHKDGIMKLAFKNDNYTCTYLQFATKKT